MSTRGRGTHKPHPREKKKDAMTSKPSRDKRTFTSRQDPSGTGPSKGDAFDRTLKVSHNRATPQQTNAAADRDLPRRRLPVVDRPANRSRRGGGG